MTRKTIFSLLVLFTLLILGTGLAVGADWTLAVPAGDTPEVIYRGLSPVVQFDVSPPLRDIVTSEIPAGEYAEIPERDSGLEGPLGPQDKDPLAQNWVGPNAIPEPLISFDGPSNLAGVSPPDPVGDVGPNHYVAMSNLWSAVYAKDGTLLMGPFPNNDLWNGFGGDCETDNSGDPIVVYDQMADRWMLTQFTSSGPTYFNCVALSTGPDPTGTYYRYAVGTGTNFPDYPKYGVWPDAYYISTREFAGASFAGVGAYALNRAQMLVGDPTPDIVSFLIPPGGTPYNVGDGLLPSDMDGSALPPAGSPNYFMGSMDNGGPYGAPQDALTLWEFEVDFDTPANSSFTLVDTIPIAPYDTIYPCSPTSRNCIPQPDTTNKIDILSYRQRPMWRLAYRNFGSHEALVTNQSVEAASNMAGMRWWEIRDPGGTPTLYQEGTYAPGITDGIHRWMGSIAMDSSGNMALGYSASNATTTYPSSWYTGRLASDPLGTMPQGEGSIIDGTGSQTGSGRWGDYTSMNVDPVDDCTFWYVNQYVPVTSSVGWRLRIGAFRFDECGAPDFTLSAEPGSLDLCTGSDALYDVIVGSVSGFSDPVTLSTQGEPAGTTTDFSVNPVIPPGMSLLTVSNTGGAAAGNYNIEIMGVAPTSTHTTTVGLNLFDTAPDPPMLINPPDGAIDVSVTPTFEWSATGTEYTIDIATDPGFANIVETAMVNATMYTSGGLETETTYYWRVTAGNPCGTGMASETFSFTTAAVPPILLVDDDDNGPDVRGTYESALNALGLDYDVWDTNNSDNEPSAGDLSPYEVVIWFTGDEFGGFAGPGAAGETALGSWLDDSNCLFLSSQDYHFDRGLTPFMSNYLGVSNVTDDNGAYSSVTGQGGVYGGLGPYTLVYPFTDYSDVIQPDGTAEVAFQGNNGNNSAVDKDAVVYRTTFWVFPWEAISSAANREEAMQTTLDWCGGLVNYGVNLSGDMAAGGNPGDTIDYLVDITNTGNVTDTFDLALSGNDWTSTLSTTSITLGAGETDSFMVSVDIPAGAFGGDMDTVMVTATSVNDPGASDTANLTTSVDISYGVSLTGDTSGEGAAGTMVMYEVEVMNNGNITDTFDLMVSGNSWTTSLSTTSVMLAPGESTMIMVTVEVPLGVAGGDTDTATVTATSAGDPDTSDSLDITTTASDYLMYLPIMLKQP